MCVCVMSLSCSCVCMEVCECYSGAGLGVDVFSHAHSDLYVWTTHCPLGTGVCVGLSLRYSSGCRRKDSRLTIRSRCVWWGRECRLRVGLGVWREKGHVTQE